MDKNNCDKPQFSGEWVKLGDAFELRMGKTPSRKNMAYWRNGKYDWVSIADLGAFDKYVAATKEQISDAAIAESRIKPAPANTVLMSFKLSIGKVAITRSPVFTNEAIMALVDRGKYRIDPTFIYHQCKAKDWTAGSNTAVMGKTLNKKTLSETRIYLPGFERQIQIAAELDYLDEQIASANAVSERLDALVKSRFIEMFGNGKYPEYELGSRMKTISGGTPSRKHPEYYKDGLIPWLTSGEINKGKIEAPEYFITEEGLSHSSAKMTPANSVVVAMYGATAGQVGIVTYATTTNQAVCCIAPTAACNPAFLRFSLENRKKWMIRQCLGGAQPNISQGVIKKVRIPDAPLESQESFASIVRRVDKLRFMLLGNPSPTYRGRSFCCSTNSGNGGVILEVKDYLAPAL